MKLNYDKIEGLLVASSLVLGSTLRLAGVLLTLKPSVGIFGMPQDPSLLLHKQIAAVAKSSYFQLWLVHQLRPFMDKKDLAMVSHALIISQLDCSNVFHLGLPLKMTLKLEPIQNAAVHVLTGRSKYYYVTYFGVVTFASSSFPIPIQALVLTCKTP